MRRRPVLLVNPPSPRGRTANREGFGGLGVSLAGRRGFVYPAQLLAEAAALLEGRGVPYRAGDCVIRPLLGPARIFARLPELSLGFPVIARVAAATLDHDVAWLARHFAAWEAPLVVTGTALGAVADRILPLLPRATLSEEPTGYTAALRLMGLDPEPGPAEGWPFASWDRLPLGRGKRLPLWHGRGCMHVCTYCPYVIATGRRHLLRSAERTLEEFRYQVRRHRPKRVVFRDPVFGLDRASTLELLGGIPGSKRRERAPFEIETRPEVLDAGLLDALRAAGCVEIKLGVETLEAGALLATHRLGDPVAVRGYGAAALDALRLAAERQLTVRVYLLRGLPGSTPEGDAETARRFSTYPMVSVKEYLPPEPERAATIPAGG